MVGMLGEDVTGRSLWDNEHEDLAAALEKVYQTARKCAAGFKMTIKIVFDKVLPKWNYRAVPEPVLT